MLTRPFLIYVGLLTVALVGSFLATLWLTTPKVPEPAGAAVERLLASKIASYPELNHAASAAGFHTAESMRGNIDSLRRANEREVVIDGWLADIEGDATPINLFVFVDGTLAGKGQTKGERADLTRAFGLAFGAEKNVVFALSFPCAVGAQPVVAGVGSTRHYVPMPVSKCP